MASCSPPVALSCIQHLWMRPQDIRCELPAITAQEALPSALLGISCLEHWLHQREGLEAGLPVLDSRGPVVLAAWPKLKARPHASRGLDALPACPSTLSRSRGGEWNRAAHPSEDPHP